MLRALAPFAIAVETLLRFRPAKQTEPVHLRQSAVVDAGMYPLLPTTLF